jgi:SNF2 family DNA or RNA helicase
MSDAPPLYPSQVEDIRSILDRPYYALLNRPGTGKTRTVIEAAAELYRQGEIDTVLAVVPPSVRTVWADPDPVLGEVAKWAEHTRTDTVVREYHARTARVLKDSHPEGLLYLVTNPEFVRRAPRLDPLLDWLSERKPLLVIEESWWMRSPMAAQTKALMKIRKFCRRVVALNGTPGEPSDLFSMFHLFNPGILGVKSWYGFKYRYTQLGGWMGKEIVGYSEEQRAEFARATAPYAVARTEALWTDEDPVRTQIDVRLTPETWKLYTAMRDDCVARLSDLTSVAVSAGVTVMRLSQLTAGLLGGLQAHLLEGETQTRVVSDEKVRALVDEVRRDPARKIVVFCRFRREIEAISGALAGALPEHQIMRLWGNQDRAERQRVHQLFAPGGDPAPAVVVAHPASGGVGINLAQAAVTYFATNDYSSRIRNQAEGRTNRPGQTRRPRFVDLVATGPNGERTVDHLVLAALRKQEKIETWTADIWKAKLTA